MRRILPVLLVLARPAGRVGVRAGALLFAGAWLWLLCCGIAVAQDVEPRRWAPFPVGTNVLGLGYAYSEGDIFFNPVTQIEDAEVRMHSVIASYVRAFGFFGKTARVDLLVPYAERRNKRPFECQPKLEMSGSPQSRNVGRG